MPTSEVISLGLFKNDHYEEVKYQLAGYTACISVTTTSQSVNSMYATKNAVELRKAEKRRTAAQNISRFGSMVFSEIDRMGNTGEGQANETLDADALRGSLLIV